MSRTRDRSIDRPQTRSDGTIDEAWSPSLGQSDAVVETPEAVEGFPWGGGIEETIPAGQTETVIEWSVPVLRQAEIDRCTVSIPDGATATVWFAGTRYGPYSGPYELSIEYGGATLIGGSLVRVVATAAAGSQQTIKAHLTGRLF